MIISDKSNELVRDPKWAGKKTVIVAKDSEVPAASVDFLKEHGYEVLSDKTIHTGARGHVIMGTSQENYDAMESKLLKHNSLTAKQAVEKAGFDESQEGAKKATSNVRSIKVSDLIQEADDDPESGS